MAPGCWFLVWLCWLPLILAGAEEQQRRGGGGCSPKMCGNINISSPFWLTYWDEPQTPCGSSDYQVTCDDNNTPVLRNAVSSFHQGFAIKHISYKESSLRVVDLYAQNSSELCQGPNWNASVKVDGLFKISPAALSLILYNCTTAAKAARWNMGLVEMGCGNKSSLFVGMGGRYDANGSYAGYYIKGCNAIVLPVMSSSSGVASASDYKQLINHGFFLTWDTPHPPPIRDAGNSTGTEFVRSRCCLGAAHLQFNGCGGMMPARPSISTQQKSFKEASLWKDRPSRLVHRPAAEHGVGCRRWRASSRSGASPRRRTSRGG